MKQLGWISPLLIALTIGLSLGQAKTASAEPPSRGRIIFLRCASCHDISTTASPKIGPNLLGVYGRKAGSLPGYNYSPAMRKQTFIWDEAHLNRWLTDPAALVPDTAMGFAGLPNEADRLAVIEYLRKAAK